MIFVRWVYVVCLQLRDKRKPDSPTHYLAAHTGPVYNCEWHLERDNCFVTGGRDKNLKVRSHDSHVTHYTYSYKCMCWLNTVVVCGCYYY